MKKFFFKGLAFSLPFILTISIVYYAIAFLYNNVGNPIGSLLRSIINPDSQRDFLWSVIGFVVAVLIVFSLGILLGSYVGKKIYAMFERIVSSAPLLRSIYPTVKELSGFILPSGKKKLEFKKPV
ncbi:MAG: DUF502 domain-containing protein, partial [Planctomycetes bacterium]|nr:DUF502 domain-containing protein [Planctomycetota bacterium]